MMIGSPMYAPLSASVAHLMRTAGAGFKVPGESDVNARFKGVSYSKIGGKWILETWDWREEEAQRPERPRSEPGGSGHRFRRTWGRRTWDNDPLCFSNRLACFMRRFVHFLVVLFAASGCAALI